MSELRASATALGQSGCCTNTTLQIYAPGSGQLEPSQSCAWSGGTSTFQAGVPIKLKSPPLGTLKWGDFNFACMPACKVEVWGIHAGPTQLYLLSRCELWLSGGFTLARPSCMSNDWCNVKSKISDLTSMCEIQATSILKYICTDYSSDGNSRVEAGYIRFIFVQVV